MYFLKAHNVAEKWKLKKISAESEENQTNETELRQKIV